MNDEANNVIVDSTVLEDQVDAPIIDSMLPVTVADAEENTNLASSGDEKISTTTTRATGDDDDDDAPPDASRAPPDDAPKFERIGAASALMDLNKAMHANDFMDLFRSELKKAKTETEAEAALDADLGAEHARNRWRYTSLLARCPCIFLCLFILIPIGLVVYTVLFYPIKLDLGMDSFAVRDHWTAENYLAGRGAQTYAFAFNPFAYPPSTLVDVSNLVDQSNLLSTPSKKKRATEATEAAEAAAEATQVDNEIVALVNVFIEMANKDENILNETHIEQARVVEEAVMSIDGYEELCVLMTADVANATSSNATASSRCRRPLSLLNFFYPYTNEVTGRQYCNGYGENQTDDFVAALAMAVQLGVTQWTDGKLSLSNLESNNLRLQVVFSTKDIKDYLKLMPAAIASAQAAVGNEYEVFYGSKDALQIEIEAAIFHDAKLAIASIVMVCVLMIFLMKSCFLALLGTFEIILSFPFAFFFYRVVFGFVQVGILNAISLFLIIGIGADDLFAFHSVCQQSQNLPLRSRMKVTLEHAGFATMMTSVTTSIAFIVNAFSPIPALASFGLFMTLLVVTNYLLLLTMFVCILSLYIKYVKAVETAIFRLVRFMWRRWRAQRKAAAAAAAAAAAGATESKEEAATTNTTSNNNHHDNRHHELGVVDKIFWHGAAPCINFCRVPLTIIFFASFLASLYFASSLRPSTEPTRMFDKTKPIQRFVDWQTTGNVPKDMYDALLLNTIAVGCDGVPGSDAVLDKCGVCNGDNECLQTLAPSTSPTVAPPTPPTPATLSPTSAPLSSGATALPTPSPTTSPIIPPATPQPTPQPTPFVFLPFVPTPSPVAQTPHPTQDPNSCMSGKIDLCDVCDGTNECLGCDGVPYSAEIEDACGVCGGDGSSCGGGGGGGGGVGSGGLSGNPASVASGGAVVGDSNVDSIIASNDVRVNFLFGIKGIDREKTHPLDKTKEYDVIWDDLFDLQSAQAYVALFTLRLLEQSSLFKSIVFNPMNQLEARLCIDLLANGAYDAASVDEQAAVRSCTALPVAHVEAVTRALGDSIGPSFKNSMIFLSEQYFEAAKAGGNRDWTDWTAAASQRRRRRRRDAPASLSNFSQLLYELAPSDDFIFRGIILTTYGASVKSGTPSFSASGWRDGVVAFVEQWNAEVPESAQVIVACEKFIGMETEISAVSGIAYGILISLVIFVLALFLFTLSWLLGLLALIVQLGSTCIVLGAMGWMGWSLGAIEAVAITVLVGLSVDLLLHLGEKMAASPVKTRYARMRFGLGLTASPLISACLTTIGSSAVLLFCDVTIFRVFGTIVILNLGVSLLLALVFFPALVALMGPDGICGSFLQCCFCCNSRFKQALEDAEKEMQSKFVLTYEDLVLFSDLTREESEMTAVEEGREGGGEEGEKSAKRKSKKKKSKKATQKELASGEDLNGVTGLRAIELLHLRMRTRKGDHSISSNHHHPHRHRAAAHQHHHQQPLHSPRAHASALRSPRYHHHQPHHSNNHQQEHALNERNNEEEDEEQPQIQEGESTMPTATTTTTFESFAEKAQQKRLERNSSTLPFAGTASTLTDPGVGSTFRRQKIANAATWNARMEEEVKESGGVVDVETLKSAAASPTNANMYGTMPSMPNASAISPPSLSPAPAPPTSYGTMPSVPTTSTAVTATAAASVPPPPLPIDFNRALGIFQRHDEVNGGIGVLSTPTAILAAVNEYGLSRVAQPNDLNGRVGPVALDFASFVDLLRDFSEAMNSDDDFVVVDAHSSEFMAMVAQNAVDFNRALRAFDLLGDAAGPAAPHIDQLHLILDSYYQCEVPRNIGLIKDSIAEIDSSRIFEFGDFISLLNRQQQMASSAAPPLPPPPK